MQIKISEGAADAAERVRKRDGDRSITATVERLITEGDTKCGDESERRFMARETMPMTRAEAATGRRAKRKGAR